MRGAEHEVFWGAGALTACGPLPLCRTSSRGLPWTGSWLMEQSQGSEVMEKPLEVWLWVADP